MSLSPDTAVRRSGGDLADYAALLRRRWPILLACLLAGTGGAAALLYRTPPSYTASAHVLVTATGVQEPTNQVTARQREALNLDTEAQIAQSAVVARKARVALRGTPGPVEVSVPPNTSVLEISYTAADPNSAAAGASAYAQAYLAHRGEAATQALAVQLKTLLDKLKQVNAALSKVVADLPGLDKGSAQRTIALQRRSVLSRQVYNLTVKYDGLKTIAVTPGSVISEAVAPTEPSAPSPPLYLGSGFMIGLLAGTGLAWLRDRLDLRLRTASDLTRLTGLDIVTGERIHNLGTAGGAVVLVPLPGSSAREVAQAVRELRGRRVPVIGAVAAFRDGRPGEEADRRRPEPGREEAAVLPPQPAAPPPPGAPAAPLPPAAAPRSADARAAAANMRPLLSAGLAVTADRGEPPAGSPETVPLAQLPAVGRRVFPP
ncbi:YveK family protein [Planomonospora venezuelensis]|uniref:Capsular polysaccharide biosynthesis protein n=1 Tax=Planomonospora venezuelensis TaxID=1999 RepID=A0A841D2V9_PLAVE|nr:Wzz/FepE/Etk N-terminal domain-containing protein [Planomonospora venezuelensis]MBB5962728.1 capsular polysaccharide biosynthesis protein [Planomonospora venezuelensis]GIM99476.1 hypothetical protein Pve01_11350 [Planomonospora venezuelensis]